MFTILVFGVGCLVGRYFRKINISRVITHPYADEWGTWPNEYYEDKDYWR